MESCLAEPSGLFAPDGGWNARAGRARAEVGRTGLVWGL